MVPSCSHMASRWSSFNKSNNGGGEATRSKGPLEGSSGAVESRAGRFTVEPISSKSDYSIFFKTRVCKFHASGMCRKGSACGFAHDSQELRSWTDLSRTQMCPTVASGSACHGTGCRFAHAREELRSVSRAQGRRRSEGASSMEKDIPSPTPIPIGLLPTLLGSMLDPDIAKVSAVIGAAVCKPQVACGKCESLPSRFESNLTETTAERGIYDGASSGDELDSDRESRTVTVLREKNTFLNVEPADTTLGSRRRSKSVPGAFDLTLEPLELPTLRRRSTSGTPAAVTDTEFISLSGLGGWSLQWPSSV